RVPETAWGFKSPLAHRRDRPGSPRWTGVLHIRLPGVRPGVTWRRPGLRRSLRKSAPGERHPRGVELRARTGTPAPTRRWRIAGEGPLPGDPRPAVSGL